MENIFNNIVDISKVISSVNNKPNTDVNSVNNIATLAPKEEPIVNNDKTQVKNNTDIPEVINSVPQNIININSLLSKNNEDNRKNGDISANSTNTIYGDVNNIMSHINELNEKIIYYNTLAKLKEKENQQLINENKILRTNLELIKRRYNLK